MASAPPSDDTYPPGVTGGKFAADGRVLPFPGNTIVAHLSPTSPLHTHLLALYDSLRTSPLAPLYTLLPPSSWHMTIFEGVCDRVREPAYWPADLALDAPLADCTALLASRLAGLDLREDGGPPYRMRMEGVDPLEIGIGLHLEPRGGGGGGYDDDEARRRMRALRDRLADALGLRMPAHETYGLHLSIAYLLRRLTEDQERELKGLVLECLRDAPVEFELGAPEFCTFEDMFAFKRVFYLGERS